MGYKKLQRQLFQHIDFSVSTTFPLLCQHWYYLHWLLLVGYKAWFYHRKYLYFWHRMVVSLRRNCKHLFLEELISKTYNFHSNIRFQQTQNYRNQLNYLQHFLHFLCMAVEANNLLPILTRILLYYLIIYSVFYKNYNSDNR